MTWLGADGTPHEESLVDKTDVTFRDLSDEEINHYVTIFRPLDKAGAYGIQEWIGYVGVTGINGCYFNVMGLPLQPLYTMLKNWSLHYTA
jgi:septum formation protein